MSPELGCMDDTVKITKKVLVLLNDIFQNPAFLEQENCAFLFGSIDEDGNICFSLCTPRKKLISSSKDCSEAGIISGISKMADNYRKKEKMICCIINISPDNRFVSDDFLKEQHSKCLRLRDKLGCDPVPIGCVFGYGGYNPSDEQPILRLFGVDSVGILEYKNIEMYNENYFQEINEGKEAKS